MASAMSTCFVYAHDESIKLRPLKLGAKSNFKKEDENRIFWIREKHRHGVFHDLCTVENRKVTLAVSHLDERVNE